MRNFIIIFCLALGFSAEAANQRLFQDLKLPTQQMVEHQEILNPAASGNTDILSSNAGLTSAGAVSVSSFAAQPDVPRTLKLKPGGTAASVGSCTAVVRGTDYFGQAMSENFSIAAGNVASVGGVKAFSTVTSLYLPATCEVSPFGATWSIGYGESVGLKRCMAAAGNVFFSTLNGAKESSGPTVAVGSSIGDHTANFAGTKNGSNDFDIFFMQNYGCHP